MRGKLRFDLKFDGSCYSGWNPQPNANKPALYTVVATAWAEASGESGFGPVLPPDWTLESLLIIKYALSGHNECGAKARLKAY